LTRGHEIGLFDGDAVEEVHEFSEGDSGNDPAGHGQGNHDKHPLPEAQKAKICQKPDADRLSRKMHQKDRISPGGEFSPSSGGCVADSLIDPRRSERQDQGRDRCELHFDVVSSGTGVKTDHQNGRQRPFGVVAARSAADFPGHQAAAENVPAVEEQAIRAVSRAGVVEENLKDRQCDSGRDQQPAPFGTGQDRQHHRDEDELFVIAERPGHSGENRVRLGRYQGTPGFDECQIAEPLGFRQFTGRCEFQRASACEQALETQRFQRQKQTRGHTDSQPIGRNDPAESTPERLSHFDPISGGTVQGSHDEETGQGEENRRSCSVLQEIQHTTTNRRPEWRIRDSRLFPDQDDRGVMHHDDHAGDDSDQVQKRFAISHGLVRHLGLSPDRWPVSCLGEGICRRSASTSESEDKSESFGCHYR